MIQSPITKTGEIRYFEFIKIFVLVSFFYALFSVIVDQPEFILTISPLISFNIMNVLVFIVVSVELIKELRILFDLIRSYVVTLLPQINVSIDYIVTNIVLYITNYIEIKDHQKLCVVRC